MGYNAKLQCSPTEVVISAEFEAAAPDWRDQYKLMIGSVAPQPIALVTKLARHGPNPASSSFFSAVG